ncbi:NUDIX domain-containing protein [Brevibacillus borstelensis]|uniref:NUDIX hydrolase n=1 Tax=Brevibacillus borstelensis TaxID=45462 RepID=UPI00203D0DED|nr:NUDIX domain-containing protein [Brevibacillus borstelensis]MCM3590449.1 NUDIX domain-containing protein [Brevibacillus borstelensis]
MLIRRITDSDILSSAPEFMDAVSRYGSRGVLVDDMLNVAMMYMSKINLYKLPGGGIDEGENIRDAFLREIKEETGYEAEIIHELGCIEEHKNKNNFMQYSYCFIAKAIKGNGNTMLTESESQLGMTMEWMTFEKALEVMDFAEINCVDYSTRFMIVRDKTILEKAINLLMGDFVTSVID